MGGDNAPGEIVRGACLAAREFGIEVALVGREEEIAPHLSGQEGTSVQVVDARDVISMDDNPSTVMKEKKDASMTVALRMLAADEGDAVVSAGSTGALLIQSTLLVKRIKGIRRAALAPVIPTAKGGALLIDCGANAECTPEYLLQFALMGASYAERVLGMKDARVGLVNNGTEEHKGGALQQQAYQLLKSESAAGKFRFVGNIEGRDVALGAADVVVCDGFTGNVLLKTMEGVGIFFTNELKGIFKKNPLTKLSALMVKDGIKAFKKKMDYNETGGAPLLGIAKPVIKAHGSSKAFTLRSAIEQAMHYIQAGSIREIEQSLQTMESSSKQ